MQEDHQNETQARTINRNPRSKASDIQTHAVYHSHLYYNLDSGEAMNMENEGSFEGGNIPHEPESHEKCEKTSTICETSDEPDLVQLQLRVPRDIKKIIKDNGGAGFVVGLVRSVMR